jgi:aconitase B
MPTSVTSGSITLTASEQTVGAQQTTAGTYVLDIDLVNMAAGDVIELYIYKTVLTSAGTERLYDKVSFVNAQGDPVFSAVPVPIVTGQTVTFKLKQPTGTGRAVPYTIMTL